MRHPQKYSRTAITVAVAVALAACTSTSGDDDGASAREEASAQATESAVADTPLESTDAGNDPKEEGSADKTSPDEGLDEDAPGRPTRDGRQVDVFDRIPGDKDPSCVRVGSARDMRSGGFIGGAFDEARQQFGTKAPGRKRNQVRLYWVPMHAKAMDGVIVEMTQVDTGATTTVNHKRVADTGDWKFYDTTLTISEPGVWRFVVRSGTDEGCFEAEFS